MDGGLSSEFASGLVGISVWTSDKLNNLDGAERDMMRNIVDELGTGSAIAQNLSGPITTMEKVIPTDHKIYLMCGADGVQGMLKVGIKHLYIYDKKGSISEIDPLCLLDFYVKEKVQRTGVGVRLFNAMLENEKVDARCLAYDRPSPKLMPFLKKHFSLASYEPQPNRFVVFNDYFEEPV